MSDQGNPRGERVSWISPWAICGLLMQAFLTINVVIVWVGYWLMSREWPGALKLWLCTAMGIASWTWLLSGRRRIFATLSPTVEKRALSVSGALSVLGLVLLEAIFVTWVIAGPPFL